jgi:hypothetical protein
VQEAAPPADVHPGRATERPSTFLSPPVNRKRSVLVGKKWRAAVKFARPDYDLKLAGE